MNERQRVIEVFEIIAHKQIDWRIVGSVDADTVCLQSAQILLEPRLHGLMQQVDGIHKRYGIKDPRIESLRAAEAVTAYVIGILSGLDLAGRPEIVGQFADIYAMAKRSVDSLFITNFN